MSHRTLVAGLAAVAAALAPAAAAQAQTSLDTTYYFSCAGPQPAAKVQNIVAFAQVANWTTTKPSASFQSGAGCGFADVPAPGGVRLSDSAENAYDAFYKGPHDKAIEKVKFEFHNLVTSRARAGTTQKLIVRLLDGTGLEYTTLAEREVDVTPVVSSTGATERFDITIDGLKIKKASGRILTVGVHSLEAGPQAWVHGASEIPAGVTFTEPAPLPTP